MISCHVSVEAVDCSNFCLRFKFVVCVKLEVIKEPGHSEE